jgi:DNA-binding MarR family transcriptional regulator
VYQMKTGPQSGDRLKAIELTVRTLHEIFQAVDQFSRRTLRRHGVSGPQIWALRTLQEHGAMPMGGLARRLHLHVSTVTGIVDRLEHAGFVRRGSAPGDSRIVRVTITQRGQRVAERAPEPPRSRLAHGLSRLSSRELSRVAEGVLLLARIMGSAGEEP